MPLSPRPPESPRVPVASFRLAHLRGNRNTISSAPLPERSTRVEGAKGHGNCTPRRQRGRSWSYRFETISSMYQIEEQRRLVDRLRLSLPPDAPTTSSVTTLSLDEPPHDTVNLQPSFVHRSDTMYIKSVPQASLSVNKGTHSTIQATAMLARSEFVAPIGSTVTTTALVSLASIGDATELLRQTRLTLRIVLCVDMSSSMKGQRWEGLIRAVEGCLDCINPKEGDMLSVIGFNDSTNIIGELGVCDNIKAAKGRLLSSLREIEPNGTTNMLDGLILSAQTIDKMANQNTKNHIILISDGYPDKDNNKQDILAVVDQCILHRVSVSAIGCGMHFNEDLLMLIASTGCGNYYYTEDEDLLVLLRNELLSLSKIVARDVRVELCGYNVAIDDVFGYVFKRDSSKPAEKVTIRIGDMRACDTKKDLLIGISWIQTEKREKEILDVRISYMCIVSGYKEISTTLKADIRPPEETSQPKHIRSPMRLEDGHISNIVKPSPSLSLVIDKVQKVAMGNAILDCIQRMSSKGDNFALQLLRKQIMDFQKENDFLEGISAGLLNIISQFESRVRELRAIKNERERGIMRMKLTKDMKMVARRLLRN